LQQLGCTSNFEEINTNPTEELLRQYEQDFNNIKGAFVSMFNNIMFVLNGNTKFKDFKGYWSGYMATGTAFEEEQIYL
jgi:hypothetical protein